MVKTGGPAFPCEYNMDSTDGQSKPVEPFHGMSMRDWFAGQALVGLIADRSVFDRKIASETAYQLADAMLAAREKPK